MEFDAVLLPPRRAESIARGLLARPHDQRRPRRLRRGLPGQAGADRRAGRDAATVRASPIASSLTLADRIAVGLTRLGVGRNDVVAMQLPNWWQFTLLYLACSRIGAVLNPLMHDLPRARAVVHAQAWRGEGADRARSVFRGFDHEAMARSPAAEPAGAQACRRRRAAAGANRLRRAADDAGWENERRTRAAILTRQPARPRRRDAADLHLGHDRRAQGRDAYGQHARWPTSFPMPSGCGSDSDDVVLMASPMAHQTGFMYGLMMPIMLRASAVLQDIWEPSKAVELIRDRARHLHDGLDAVPDRPRQAPSPRAGHAACRRLQAPSCAPARRSPARWSSRRARCWAPRSSRPGA